MTLSITWRLSYCDVTLAYCIVVVSNDVFVKTMELLTAMVLHGGSSAPDLYPTPTLIASYSWKNRNRDHQQYSLTLVVKSGTTNMSHRQELSLILGLYSLCGLTSFRKTPWGLEAAIFGFRIFQSLGNSHRQRRCRDACQISERYDHYNIQSRCLETWRDLMERRSVRLVNRQPDLLLHMQYRNASRYLTPWGLVMT